MSVPVWPIKNDNHDEEGQRLIEKLLIVIIFLFPVKKKISTILARGADQGCSVMPLSIYKGKKIILAAMSWEFFIFFAILFKFKKNKWGSFFPKYIVNPHFCESFRKNIHFHPFFIRGTIAKWMWRKYRV